MDDAVEKTENEKSESRVLNKLERRLAFLKRKWILKMILIKKELCHKTQINRQRTQAQDTFISLQESSAVDEQFFEKVSLN